MKLAALLLVCGLACATPSHVAANADEAASLLREQMAKAPDDIRRGILEDELAKTELDRARHTNTVLAYRQFLNDFPNGEEAATVKVLLEQLRFEEASRLNTHQGWEDFLEEHPRGTHANDAREHLGNIEITAAVRSPSLELVRHTLARFPEHPHRDVLLAHEDDLAWVAASAADIETVDAYIATHPTGTHRLEAARKRDELEQLEILDAEDLGRAEARARAADATARRRATVAALKLARALSALNMDDVKAVAEIESTEPEVLAVRQQARTFLDSVTAKPFPPDVLSLIAAARPGGGLGSHDDLVARTRTGDPVDQVAALRELPEWGLAADVDVALAALRSHYVAVRLAALECLSSLATGLKPAVWRSVERSHEEDTLAQARDDAWMRVAALRDASGHSADALDAWRQSLHTLPDDLLAETRIFTLLSTGKDRLSLNVAARDLTKTAIAYGESHVPPPTDPNRAPPPGTGPGELIGVPGDLSAARQICAAITLASKGNAILGSDNGAVSPEERDLIHLAHTDSETAITRLRARQQELEQGLVSEGVRFSPCGQDLAGPVVATSRQQRANAVIALGRLGDPRLRTFIESLRFTPGPELRAAVDTALQQLTVAAGQ